MKLELEANIFPRWDVQPPEGLPSYEDSLTEVAKMERFFREVPLTEKPVATLAAAEIDTGLEHSMDTVENYQFIITRRFTYGGELHVGGANGEILNVYLLIEGLKTFLKTQRDKQEGK